MFPMEALEIIHLLSYLKKVESMDEHRWPNMIDAEELKWRKKTWRNQNYKWMRKWGINWQCYPNSKEEIKKFRYLKNSRLPCGRNRLAEKSNMSKFSTHHNHMMKRLI